MVVVLQKLFIVSFATLDNDVAQTAGERFDCAFANNKTFAVLPHAAVKGRGTRETRDLHCE